MSKQRRKPKPSAPARFKVGDRVRVKPGTRDDDHPDIPLGGWAGTISEVNRHGMFSVRWSRETLANIHPVYKKRCAIDGMTLEEYWLGEDDLELDPGGPLTIEQPSAITPRPLSADEEGDRVRMVFGLTADDFLPGVNDDSLETYYDFLKKRLSFPFEARYSEENEEELFGPSTVHRVKVVALDCELFWNEEDGVLCKVHGEGGEQTLPLTELELRRADRNRQFIEDYSAWFHGELSEDVDEDGEFDENEEFEDEEESDEGDEDPDVPEKTTWRDAAILAIELIAFAASVGAVIGSAVAVMPWARWAACIGGGAWGVFEAVVQARYAQKDLPLVAPRLQKHCACMIGLVTGAIHGSLFGIMAVAILGAALGGIVGFVLRRLLSGERRWDLLFFPKVPVLGAACGVIAQAFYMDTATAYAGLWWGTLIGLASGLILCFVVVPLTYLAFRRQIRSA